MSFGLNPLYIFINQFGFPVIYVTVASMLIYSKNSRSFKQEGLIRIFE